MLRLKARFIVQKAVAHAHRKVLSRFGCHQAHRYGTYCDNYPKGRLNQYLRKLPVSLLEPNRRLIAALADQYLSHRFDLLGSGWVQVRHGMRCRGLEGCRYEMGSPVSVDKAGRWLEAPINSANLAEAQTIWRLVDAGYSPIDWHLDFKSGYRWSEETWYLNIPKIHKPGVDIKVPWELARMQHLPQLAFAFAAAKDGRANFKPPMTYLREFRNQVLDFIATNPPRFGVNWRCTMEVGLRVANWLVAYDLYRAHDAEFDSEFVAYFSRSIYEHGLHILGNLEWDPERRRNHYLADVVGLLFAAAYLPGTAETDAWLAFATQELLREVENQFNPDGSNFEASTSYHRLCAEMVTYATALILGLPPEKLLSLKQYDHRLHKVHPRLKPAPLEFYSLPKSEQLTPFPSWYIERLGKMAEFTMHITKPNRCIPQIGDNDNGRFLKLDSVYRQMTVAEAKARYGNLEGYDDLPDDAIYWDEDHLDHRSLVAAINGLFARNDLATFAGDACLETDLVRGLAGNVCFRSDLNVRPMAAAQVRIGKKEGWLQLSRNLDADPEKQQQVLEIPTPGAKLRKGLKLYAYPDFGLYLYMSERLYLMIRCGPIGQKGVGGHAHNDQLSIELNVDGEDWIVDPGTYLYTPFPKLRNECRSARSHSAPWVEGKEPGNLDLGLFKLGDEAKAECLYFGPDGFIGKHRGYKNEVVRLIAIREDKIVVQDSFSKTHQIQSGITVVAGNKCDFKVDRKVFFPGYGIKMSIGGNSRRRASDISGARGVKTTKLRGQHP